MGTIFNHIEPTYKTILTANNTKLEVCEGFIFGDEYILCEKAAADMYASKKTGMYGKGLANRSDDPYCAERTGYLGEGRLSQIFGIAAKLYYIEGGDGGKDCLLLGRFKTDVKIATSLKDYECGLVQVVNEHGVEIPLLAYFYVFGYVVYDLRKQKKALVALVGAMQKNDVEKYPIVAGRYPGSKHKNREIPYKDLIPIRTFIETHTSTTPH